MKELGCGAVVFPVDYTASEELVNAYVQAAGEEGLVIAEVGAWCNPLAADEQERQAAMERCVCLLYTSPVWNRKEDILNKVLPPEHAMPSVSMPTEEMLKEYYPSTGEYTRGAGVLDLAYAIVSREENRAGSKLAVHVTEAINGIMQAARSGEIYHMRTCLLYTSH